MSKEFAKLPPIHEVDRFLADRGLAQGQEVRELVENYLTQMRQQNDKLRNPSFSRQDILEEIAQHIGELPNSNQRVINATGVVIHTNLGRSLFSQGMAEKVSKLLREYHDLEFDLKTGKRGRRGARVEELLRRLTGAEAALVVNNNAAALLLCLQVLARSKEVIVSRGELVEIGGSFRVPEVMEASGALLKEVGATNRTHLEDYEAAIGESTALILKVHSSNYKVLGFTKKPKRKDLAELAQKQGLIFVEDQGSGIIEKKGRNQFGEDSVQLALKEGAQIVTISGDKVLGGPQAGILLGEKELIGRLAKSPLYRALRPDKVTLLLLEEVLLSYLRGSELAEIPTQRMLHETPEVTRRRLERLLERIEDLQSDLGSLRMELEPSLAKPGGGSLPLVEVDSCGLYLTHPSHSAEELLAGLRGLSTPVIGIIRKERVILDGRTILDEQLAELARLLADWAKGL